MSTTRYFEEQVLRKRPYLTIAMCCAVLSDPIRREVQIDDRIRWWGRVVLPDEHEARILRVITLGDGETLHNAFLDRGYRENDQ